MLRRDKADDPWLDIFSAKKPPAGPRELSYR